MAQKANQLLPDEKNRNPKALQVSKSRRNFVSSTFPNDSTEMISFQLLENDTVFLLTRLLHDHKHSMTEICSIKKTNLKVGRFGL